MVSKALEVKHCQSFMKFCEVVGFYLGCEDLIWHMKRGRNLGTKSVHSSSQSFYWKSEAVPNQ